MGVGVDDGADPEDQHHMGDTVLSPSRPRRTGSPRSMFVCMFVDTLKIYISRKLFDLRLLQSCPYVKYLLIIFSFKNYIFVLYAF